MTWNQANVCSFVFSDPETANELITIKEKLEIELKTGAEPSWKLLCELNTKFKDSCEITIEKITKVGFPKIVFENDNDTESFGFRGDSWCRLRDLSLIMTILIG